MQTKKKKDNDGNVDSLFLANRMVNYFPELKEDIAYEKLHYANFRGITFAKEKILPLFKQYVANEGANNLGKLSKSLNDIYNKDTGNRKKANRGWKGSGYAL